MKQIEDYCKVVSRIEHDPNHREEVLKMATKTRKSRPAISFRRGGIAVAAVLAAANIGIGYAVLSSRNQPETQTVGMESVETEIAACKAYDYNAQMQEFWSQVVCHAPVTTDFDGCDLDITFEEDAYTMHFTAIAGDAYQLYVFFDVYPKDMTQTFNDLSDQIIPSFRINYDDDAQEYIGFGFSTITNEDTLPTDHCWHCYAGLQSGVLMSLAGKTLEIAPHEGSDDYQVNITLDWLHEPEWQELEVIADDDCPIRYGALTPLAFYAANELPEDLQRDEQLWRSVRADENSLLTASDAESSFTVTYPTDDENGEEIFAVAYLSDGTTLGLPGLYETQVNRSVWDADGNIVADVEFWRVNLETAFPFAETTGFNYILGDGMIQLKWGFIPEEALPETTDTPAEAETDETTETTPETTDIPAEIETDETTETIPETTDIPAEVETESDETQDILAE